MMDKRLTRIRRRSFRKPSLSLQPTRANLLRSAESVNAWLLLTFVWLAPCLCEGLCSPEQWKQRNP